LQKTQTPLGWVLGGGASVLSLFPFPWAKTQTTYMTRKLDLVWILWDWFGEGYMTKEYLPDKQ